MIASRYCPQGRSENASRLAEERGCARAFRFFRRATPRRSRGLQNPPADKWSGARTADQCRAASPTPKEMRPARIPHRLAVNLLRHPRWPTEQIQPEYLPRRTHGDRGRARLAYEKIG